MFNASLDCNALMEMVYRLAFFIAFFLPSPSFADDNQRTNIAIQGEAKASCVFGAAKATAANNMALSEGAAASNTVTITTLIDATTARLLASSISLKFKALCNHAHSITIRSVNGGLRGQGTSPILGGSFRTTVDYSVMLLWGAISSGFRTNGAPGQGSPPTAISGAYAGDVALNIMIHPGWKNDLPVAADTYSDTLIITLSTPL
jgi:hypothetical protein